VNILQGRTFSSEAMVKALQEMPVDQETEGMVQDIITLIKEEDI
jgi:hypothetical protein